MIRNLFLWATAVALSAVPAFAHEKDLRTHTDASGETEVSFCARPSPNTFGFPGHAFVAFSDRPTGQPRIFRAVGHTVASSAAGPSMAFTYFGGGSVAGQQAEERYTHAKQDCLTVKVNRATYQQALAAAQPTLTALGVPANVAASAERYSLNGNDCIDFAVRVAGALRPAGLSVPARAAADTPMGFIRRLIAANP